QAGEGLHLFIAKVEVLVPAVGCDLSQLLEALHAASLGGGQRQALFSKHARVFVKLRLWQGGRGGERAVDGLEPRGQWVDNRDVVALRGCEHVHVRANASAAIDVIDAI